MFSRKQIWRRVKNTRSPWSPYFLNGSSDDTDSMKDNDSTTSFATSTSDLQYSGSCPDVSMYTSRTSSCGSSSSTDSRKGKSVKFSLFVKVCLIPTRQELSHVSSDIYWSCDECETFKQEAFTELKTYADENGCSIKESVTNLYQSFED